MPYEKNKIAQQYEEQWFEREQRIVLDVRNWNRDLMGQIFNYGLKDITKLDDLNQVVDWQNSSFYQATNQSSSVIS